MSRRRRGTGIALALTAAVAAGGCSAIPLDTGPQEGRPVGGQVRRPPNQVPNGPRRGADPAAVAEGFLRAHPGQDENLRVAREFLTGAAQQQWRPEQGIAVLERLDRPRSLGEGHVEIGGSQIGSVDASGRFTQLPQRRQLRAVLHLTRQPTTGEEPVWRIAGLPEDLGLWLTAADLSRSYVPAAVYRPAAGDVGALVPEVRWFPRSGTVSALAQAVVEPPPRWLLGVVRPLLPAGVQVEPRTVPVVDETATVSLSRSALQATPEDRRGLWAAMAETLRAVDAVPVRRVEIEVDRAPLLAPGLAGPVAGAADVQGYLSSADRAVGSVVLRRGDVLELTESAVLPGASVPARAARDLPSVPREWSPIAADEQGRQVAAVSGDRRTVGRWTATSSVRLAPFATDLVRPAYDGLDGLWLAGRMPRSAPSAGEAAEQAAGPAAVWVLDTRENRPQQPRELSAPWLEGQDVRAIAVSPEGMRLALVLRDRTDGSTSLQLAGIVRGADRRPVGLGPAIPVNPSLTQLSSVTWVDGTTLGVLGAPAPGAAVSPVRVSLGRPLGAVDEEGSGPLPPVPGATDVVGTMIGQDGLLVLTDSGEVRTRRGSAWARLAQADDLTRPAS